MREKIRKELEIIAEENYRIFAAKLIPNIDNLLGVRLPKLRKIAKKIVHLIMTTTLQWIITYTSRK